MNLKVHREKPTVVVDAVVRKAPSGSQLSQCLFCAFLVPSKDIVEHMEDHHSDFMLAISDERQLMKSLILYFCRHCQYVTLDRTFMWIHFEASHDIRVIVPSENLIDSDHELEVLPLTLENMVHLDRVYMSQVPGKRKHNDFTSGTMPPQGRPLQRKLCSGHCCYKAKKYF